MKVTLLEYGIVFSAFFLLGVSLSGMSVALVVAPILIDVATALCLFGGAGVLCTALRAFRKNSS